ncbi:MAG: LysR family transcriptional regulator [Methylobacteriaceae bacterium]|nr:LysR family transcriptional regulator [Methylobacteriaceae bacterium]
MPDRLNWDDLRLVQAIAETRSLGGAADRLGLNHSTVFRRLGALEDQLRLKLFERARVGYAATPEGAEMVALARRMADDVLDFERKIAGGDAKPSGELRIATNDSMVAYLLPPVLARFREAYPDIRLDMVVGNQPLNLSRRDADVALRATDTPPDTLVGRRIASIAWAIYAAPEVLARYGDPWRADAPWIGYGEALASVPAVRMINERVAVERIVYRTSTVVGQIEAAAAGVGFSCAPCFVGEIDARVVRCNEPQAEIGRGLWLLTHPDLRHSARVRAFMEFVGAELTRRRRLIEGAAAPAPAPAA